MTRHAHRSLLALTTVVALLLAACGTPDPQTRLERAVQETIRGSFAYELTLDADQAALGDGGPTATFAQSLLVAGRRDGDALELRVGLGGFDLLEVRSLSEEEVYVRVRLDQLAGLVGGGFDPQATLVPALEQAGVSQEVIDAVTAAFRGEWIGVQGEIDSQELQDAFRGATPTEDASAAEQAIREALCDDLTGFIECYVTVEEVREVEGATHFDVELAVRELVRAIAQAASGEEAEDLGSDLAEVPESAPAEIVVEDGRVTRVRVDLAEAVRSAGGDVPGAMALNLDLSDHGEVEPITAPEGAVTISGDQLADAIAAVAGLAVGAMGSVSESATESSVEVPAAPSPTG